VEARIAVMDVKRKTKRKAERSRKGSARMVGGWARETTPVIQVERNNWEVEVGVLFVSWSSCSE
jgi:hypothetical protein